MQDKIAVPRSVFTRYAHLLKPVDFKVWMHIFYRTQGIGNQTCAESQSKIALATGLSTTAVHRSIHRLIQRGFLVQLRNHGKNSAAVLAILLDGQAPEKPGPIGTVVRVGPRRKLNLDNEVPCNTSNTPDPFR